MRCSDSLTPFPSRLVGLAAGFCHALLFRSRGPSCSAARGPGRFTSAPPQTWSVLGRGGRDLPGSWRTLVHACPVRRPRSATRTSPWCGARDAAFRSLDGVGQRTIAVSWLSGAAYMLVVYASRRPVAERRARLTSGWWLTVAGRGFPAGFHLRFPLMSPSEFLLTRLVLAHRAKRARGVPPHRKAPRAKPRDFFRPRSGGNASEGLRPTTSADSRATERTPPNCFHR